jgi:acetoin:2,6-dichlorophenolindophenol oxidoreductase subunit alpha
VTVGDTVEFRLFRAMSRIRKFEEEAVRQLAVGSLPGTLHISIGQEAVAAGVCDVISASDYITSTHRGHGHFLAKGGDPRLMMAELFGRVSGYCGGRSGSMHLADPSTGVLGLNGIVGGGLPMAVGAAFSAKVRESKQVVCAFFGEGAVGEGVFHESLNLAALWELPVVFVCENNGYAEMSSVAVHLANVDIASYGSSYRIPGVHVEGNDVLAVRAAAEQAVTRARDGGGPTLLECITYRWHGHFEGDGQRYRDKAETEEWKKRDPILKLASVIGDSAGDRSRLADIAREAESEMREAVAWASADREPAPDSVWADVYHDEEPFARNWAGWRHGALQGAQ